MGSSIIAGDTFSWSFTLDLDSTWTGGQTFNNAVTTFSLTAGPTNVGTWSPSGVNWVITPVKNLVTNAVADQMTLQVEASNAPQIDGVNFFDLGITLDWVPGAVDVQPIAGTPSLGTTLGTLSPDLQAATYYFQLRNANIFGQQASFVASPASSQSDSSTGTPPSTPTPPRFALSLTTASDITCTAPSANGIQGTWVQLPSASSCTAPADRPGGTLLGWATSSDFPIDMARDQVSRGWGAIDGTFNGMRMIFIPAGGYTMVSGDNRLHAIWG